MKTFIIILSIICASSCSFAKNKVVKEHILNCWEFKDKMIPISVSNHIPKDLLYNSQKNKIYPTIVLYSHNKSDCIRLTVSFIPFDLFSNRDNNLIGYCIINGYKFLLYAYQLIPNSVLNKVKYQSIFIKEYDYCPYIYDGPEFYFKICNKSIEYIGSGFFE
ncbi:MAG: hypothetical protein E7081_04360 [Bacteroidales bacterium]|nr:hypothetical protein [Bacteroidales bacterium]